MNKTQLVSAIHQKKSFLCIGLDTDLSLIPSHLLSTEDPVFQFNKEIIDATLDYCVSYKINTAFYEAQGVNGWLSMQKTFDYIPRSHFVIADAKRGDIGNTSNQYAKAFFDTLNSDAITVAPYMGEDSVAPFLTHLNKWVILLALTSNEGARDFQYFEVNENLPLYKKVISHSMEWGSDQNMMYVVGATKSSQLKEIRELIPNHFLLIPGIGAQGGSLEDVVKNGMNAEVGLLVNSSRGIIYASSGQDFAEKAGLQAKLLQTEMAKFI